MDYKLQIPKGYHPQLNMQVDTSDQIAPGVSVSLRQ